MKILEISQSTWGMSCFFDWNQRNMTCCYLKIGNDTLLCHNSDMLLFHNLELQRCDYTSFLLIIYNLNEKQKFMHKAHKANLVDTGLNWTYILDVLWTSYVCSIYVLCLQGKNCFSYLLESILYKWPDYLNTI